MAENFPMPVKDITDSINPMDLKQDQLKKKQPTNTKTYHRQTKENQQERSLSKQQLGDLNPHLPIIIHIGQKKCPSTLFLRDIESKRTKKRLKVKQWEKVYYTKQKAKL